MAPRVRAGGSGDLTFLRRMLYEAAYWRGSDLPEFELGLSRPDLSKLLSDWGQREGDSAVVAEDESGLMGAAWFRFWDDGNHSFGDVSREVPELAIAVALEHRGRGVGRMLIQALIREAAAAGIAQVSLSVERDNPALHLYESVGFKIVGHDSNAYTMAVNARAA